MPRDHEHDDARRAAADHAHASVSAEPALVISHERLKHHEHHGDDLVGLATLSLGAKEHEVWRSSIGVGQSTPLHHHECEEIFVFLRGSVRAQIGERTVELSAPATVVAPAGVPHRFFNTGDVPTDAIVVLKIGSMIWDESGEPLRLPWRG